MVYKARYIFLSSVIVACCYGTVSCAKEAEDPKQQQSFEEVMYSWMGTMAEVCQKTEQKHYNIADPQACMIHAINGFLTCLDPHSGFLDPKTYTSMLESTSGQFFGVGIVMDNTRQAKDGFLLVVELVPNGPAEKAGLQRLDKIVEIDGKALDGMSTEEAASRLKGERNTKVHVKVLREGQSDMLSFDITRDIVKEQNSQAFYLPEYNIFYLALNVFSDNSVKQMEELIRQARKKKCKGIIIDVRNNSGGLLSAAIDIAGLFIKKGSTVVTIKNRDNKEIERYATTREPIVDHRLPIFILTNNYTASAAEILAGALRVHSDHAHEQNHALQVFTVGTRTFGKGSVQEVIPVSNNCAMKITIALYFLPYDTAIQGIGIEPDFLIEQQVPRTEHMKWFSRFYGQENALHNSINVKKKNEQEEEKKRKEERERTAKKSEKNWFERMKELLQQDNQLRETITLINLYNFIAQNMPEKIKRRNDAVAFMKKLYVTSDELEIVEINGK